MSESSPSKKPVALVTGGAIRVGKAIALSLARNGYDIAVHYNSSKNEAKETLSEIRATGAKAEAFQKDLAKTSELSTLIESVVDQMGGLDVLVNSASVYDRADLMETDTELYHKQFRINLDAPFFLTKAFAEQCKSGHIINILDNKIAFQQYQYSAYLLSKKALAELTKLSALELAPRFRVNGISPGITLPPSDRSEAYLEWRRQGIPMGETGDPDYIAEAVVFFLKSAFITGQILAIDGGESIANPGLNLGMFREKG